MNDNTWGTGSVLLPVPLEIVQEVARYAAAISSGAPIQRPDHETAEAITVHGQGKWTQEMITRLAGAVGYEAVLSLLDYCAERPDQWVPKAEAEAAGGFAAVQLRNELGALSKKTRKLFDKVIWPMEWKKERGSFYYRLDRTIAEWWLAARPESQR